MTDHAKSGFHRVLENRSLVFEPLAIIAILSLVTSWAIQPYVAQALAQQGTAAQGAVQAALWLSGVLSPVSALAKALGVALVCWACAVFLGERLSLGKVVSIFCIAELVFSLRDVALLTVLAARGLANVRGTSDLMVGFGLNAFVHAKSSLVRIGLESWDAFTVVWAVASAWMIRACFKTDVRSTTFLALMAFAVRTLFAAASQLYRL